MAWEDFLSALGGGMTGLAKGLSWQQEMDEDKRQREEQDIRQWNEHNLRVIARQDAQKAAQALEKERAFDAMTKTYPMQPLDKPLRGDFAAQAKELGFPTEEKAGQLASHTPSWATIGESSSPAIQGGTYRMPTSVEQKTMGEAAAAADKQRRVMQMLEDPSMTPEMKNIFKAMQITEGLGGSASLGNQYLQAPEIREAAEARDRAADLAKQNAAASYSAGETRKTADYNANRPMTQAEKDRETFKNNLPRAAPAPYVPKSQAEFEDLKKRGLIEQNIADRSWFWRQKNDPTPSGGTTSGGTGGTTWSSQGQQPTTPGAPPPVSVSPQRYPGDTGAMPSIPTPRVGAPLPITMSPGGAAGGAAPVPAPSAPAPSGPSAPAPASAAPAPPPKAAASGPKRPAAVGEKRIVRDRSGRPVPSVWSGTEWVPIPK